MRVGLHPRPYGKCWSLKWLSVVDEFTGECLVLEVARSITASGVIDQVIRLFRERGVPDYIGSDNGPEFIAKPLDSGWSGRPWRRSTSRPAPRGKTGMRRRSIEGSATSS